MKQILLMSITLLLLNSVYAQNTWTQKGGFAGVPRLGAVAFSIGSKGYIGTGANDAGYTIYPIDFWEYTPDIECAGNAIQFDGVDDYVNAGSNTSLQVDSAITMEAWIYPTGPGSQSIAGGIIVNREGEYEIARFEDGTIRFGIISIPDLTS